MGSVDIPPFLREKMKEKVQNGKEKPVADNIPPFIKKKDEEKPEGVASEEQETPSPTGTKNTFQFNFPSSLISGGKKSFLDKDIEDAHMLSNPEFNKPADPTSLKNIDYQRAKQDFEDRINFIKADVKSSPEKLSAYNQKRISEFNNKIEQAKDNLKGIFEAQGYGAKIPAEVRWAEEEKIETARKEKLNLQQSIAAEAAQRFLPEYLNPGQKFDPRAIGRSIIKVADPEQELRYKDAEKRGVGLPQITNANLELMGLDLAEQYLNSQPQNDFVKQRLAEIKSYRDDFDERNPELTAQRVREKIGAYFYDKGKSGFWGYSGRNIESAINDPETGLTPSEKKVAMDYVLPTEKKLVFSTDIPGSGFFRAGKNAIEKSILNTGNTISGWIGNRNDADRAYENLNSEIEQSRFRAPGENPTWKSELAYLNNKEKKSGLTAGEKKQKIDLEKYVDIRNGWSEFKDGVGDLTGQVVEIALLSKGIGATGRALTAFGEGGGIFGGLSSSTVGTVLSNQTTGLFLSSYLNSYDNYKSQALDLMPGDHNAANRDGYAKVMAGIEGLSERIFPDVKVLNAFTKSAAPAIRDITNRFINKEITQQVAKQELQGALSKYLKPFSKEFVKSTFQESTEEAVVDLADGMAQSIFGGQPFDLIKTGQQAINTFLTTALYSPLVSGMASHGAVRQNNSQNAFMKSAIVDFANNPTSYLKTVEDLQLNGEISQDEANEKIKLIKSASNYLKEIPENITISKKGENGETILSDKELDYPQVATYLVHRLNEGILTEKIDNLKDEALRPNLEQQLKRSIEIRKGIINDTIGVTPNLEEVTDNPKKAQELGILDANTLSSDELIGTPFHKEHIVKQEQTEDEIAEEIGEYKAAEAVKDVNDFIENDLFPETTSQTDKDFAKSNPLKFLKTVATQAQVPLVFEGKEISARDNVVDNYGEDVVKLAESVFPNIKPIQDGSKKASQEGGEESSKEGGKESSEKNAEGVLSETGAAETAETKTAPLTISPESVDVFKALTKKSVAGQDMAIGKIKNATKEKVQLARFINEKFDNIVTKLESDKKIEKICP